MQNPAGVHSGILDPVSPLHFTWLAGGRLPLIQQRWALMLNKSESFAILIQSKIFIEKSCPILIRYSCSNIWSNSVFIRKKILLLSILPKMSSEQDWIELDQDWSQFWPDQDWSQFWPDQDWIGLQFFFNLADQDWIGLRKYFLFSCDYSELIKTDLLNGSVILTSMTKALLGLFCHSNCYTFAHIECWVLVVTWT